MSLKNISNGELISRMEKLVRTERKITHLILLHILEFEDRKLYADLGFDGMYSYLTRGLGYSEASAYRRLQSARLLRQVPQAADKIENGSLNLSQLTQLQKCLKEQKQKTGEILTVRETLQVLEKIENKNTFETEKVLALEFDRPVQMHDKIRPQKDNTIRLEVTLTEEQFAELEQAKSLLSHICPDGNWSKVISNLAKIYNHRKLTGRSTIATQEVTVTKVDKGLTRKIQTPDIEADTGTGKNKDEDLISVGAESSVGKVRAHSQRIFKSKVSPKNETNLLRYADGKVGFECKAGSVELNESSMEMTDKCRFQLKSKFDKMTRQLSETRVYFEPGFGKRPRKYIPISIRRDLLKKANYCCEFVEPKTGKRCSSKYQIELDHIQPWSLGGSNAAENMRVLCREHNSLMAKRAGLMFRK